MNDDPPKPEPVPEPKDGPKAVPRVVAGERKKPLVVSTGWTRREWLIVILITVALLGFIALAIYTATRPPKNTITGVVVGHKTTGERETLLTVRPRGGVQSKTADTGYHLEVFVKEENRTYTVIVEKELWEQKKKGDTISFLRPENEQSF